MTGYSGFGGVPFIVETDGNNLYFYANGTRVAQITSAGQFLFTNLPTSSSGLAANTVWRNGTVLNII